MRIDGEQQWDPVDGATSDIFCGCPIGQRVDSETSMCSMCSEGLLCKGMSDVFLLPRYMSSPMAPFQLYHCWDPPAYRCPGERHVMNFGNICGAGFEGLQCGSCASGRFLSNADVCEPCAREDSDPSLRTRGKQEILLHGIKHVR